MNEPQKKYGNAPSILLAPTKEEDLCRALSMVEDMPHLLERAIKAYNEDELKLDGVRAMLNAQLFLDEFVKLKRQFAGALEELQEVHGLNPMEVPYDN